MAPADDFAAEGAGAGAAAVATGVFVELEPCLRKATNHTSERPTTAIKAIWKGRDICSINPPFGICLTKVEPRNLHWTSLKHPG